MKLPLDFYLRRNVVTIAKQLLGKGLFTKIDGQITGGMIVETEAYSYKEKGCHAHNGMTKRNEIMFADGGVAYVYLCYGIHHLFNVVTNNKDIPHAILVRALEPLKGIEGMLLRTNKEKLDFSLTKGPGNVSKALGIQTKHTGISLLSKELYIADDGTNYTNKQIVASPRIGVDYAGKDAELKYRFYIKGNLYVSGKSK